MAPRHLLRCLAPIPLRCLAPIPLRCLAPILIVASTAASATSSRITCLDVPVEGDWQATGIDLRAGDAVCVRARTPGSIGRMTGGHGAKPGSSPSDAEPAVLSAKIGDRGDTFPLEDGLCFLVPQPRNHAANLPGELLLSVHDRGAADAANGIARVAIGVDEGATSVVRPSVERSGFGRLDRWVSGGACLH